MRRVLPIVALALAGCQSAMQAPAEPERATAQLQPTQGKKPVGEATFEDAGNGGVHVAVIVHGLKAGSEHGFGISSDCSAGAPTQGLATLKANKSGTATLDQTLNGITVSGIVGHGLVVHDASAASSSARVACGVIQPG